METPTHVVSAFTEIIRDQLVNRARHLTDYLEANKEALEFAGLEVSITITMTNKQKHKAFWDDLKALEEKHGLRLQAFSTPQFQLAPIRPVSDELRKAAEEAAGYKPWYKRLRG